MSLGISMINRRARKAGLDSILWPGHLFKISHRYISSLVMSSTLINITALALPILFMQIYDRIIAYESTSSLYWLTFGCLAAIAIEFALRISREHITNWIQENYERDLTIQSFSAIMSADTGEFTQDDVPLVMDKFTSSSTIKTLAVGRLYQALLDLPFAIFYVVILFALDSTVGIYIVSLAVALAYFTNILRKQLKELKEWETTSQNNALNLLLDTLSRMEFVKSYTLEERILRKYEKIKGEECRSSLKVLRLRNISSNIGFIASQAALFGSIFIASFGVVEGHLTLGLLTACMMLSTRCIQPVSSFMSYFVSLSELALAKEKTNSILKHRSSVDLAGFYDMKGFNGPAEVALENIRYEEPGSNEAILDKVNVTIQPGTFHAIRVSENQGIEELLKMMAGFVTPTKGSIAISGQSLIGSELVNQGVISYVDKSVYLFNGTLIDNIRGFGRVNSHDAGLATQLLRLDELVSHLQKGYQTKIERESNSILSRSMIQLVGVARAIAVKPKLLILNQVDSGMDDNEIAVLLKALKHLTKTTTIIYASSNVDVLDQADEVYSIFLGHYSDGADAFDLFDFGGTG